MAREEYTPATGDRDRLDRDTDRCPRCGDTSLGLRHKTEAEFKKVDLHCRNRWCDYHTGRKWTPRGEAPPAAAIEHQPEGRWVVWAEDTRECPTCGEDTARFRICPPEGTDTPTDTFAPQERCPCGLHREATPIWSTEWHMPEELQDPAAPRGAQRPTPESPAEYRATAEALLPHLPDPEECEWRKEIREGRSG